MLVDADAGAVCVSRRLLCTVLLVRSCICDVASDSDASDLMYRSLALTLHEFMGMTFLQIPTPQKNRSKGAVKLKRLNDKQSGFFRPG